MITTLCIFIILIYVYYNYIEYYSQILNNSKIKDYTKWVLCDKYIAKLYAEVNGFKIPETYQVVKYPKNINFNRKSFVIKPTDLCDSKGVYIIKNGINMQTKKKIKRNKIRHELSNIRAVIGNEYYLHDDMCGGIVPYTGYIVEELILDENGMIPSDYKCYVFGGKISFIAVTYNRTIINNKQTFNSMWFTREWYPVPFDMIKNNYKYCNMKKPKAYNKMIELVENISEKIQRHCRIDVYLIGDNVYLGEFTFFSGAFLHTPLCNLILGGLWIYNPDCYNNNDEQLKLLAPSYYNQFT